MNEVQRRAFPQRLDRAIDEAQAALRPLFDSVNGAGVYHLPAEKQELLHEIMLKLGMLRIVMIHCDETAENVHRRWLGLQSVRCRVGRTDDAPRRLTLS